MEENQRNPWTILFILLFLLFFVLTVVGVWPAYQSPGSRLYASNLGYPALLRLFNVPIPVETAEVTQKTLSSYISGSGHIGYLNEVPINIEFAGVVTRVYVEPGDQVAAGEALVSLNPGSSETSIVSLDVQLKQAEFDQAKNDYERELKAYEKGLIRLTELEGFKQKLTKAEIDLRKAKESLEDKVRSRSKSALGNRGGRARISGQVDIVSPLDGEVVARSIYLGENLVQETEAAMLIGDHKVFRAALDQRFASAIQPGRVGRVYLNAYPGRSFDAEVVRTNNYVTTPDAKRPVDYAPYSFTVWFSLLNVDSNREKLLSGMNGYAVLESTFDLPTIPDSALMRYSGNDGLVMVVNEENRISLRRITYEVAESGFVGVSSGLATGEQVITRGQVALQENDIVRMKEE